MASEFFKNIGNKFSQAFNKTDKTETKKTNNNTAETAFTSLDNVGTSDDGPLFKTGYDGETYNNLKYGIPFDSEETIIQMAYGEQIPPDSIEKYGIPEDIIIAEPDYGIQIDPDPQEPEEPIEYAPDYGIQITPEPYQPIVCKYAPGPYPIEPDPEVPEEPEEPSEPTIKYGIPVEPDPVEPEEPTEPTEPEVPEPSEPAIKYGIPVEPDPVDPTPTPEPTPEPEPEPEPTPEPDPEPSTGSFDDSFVGKMLQRMYNKNTSKLGRSILEKIGKSFGVFGN